MKNLLKKWIFIAQFHFQDPDPQHWYAGGWFMQLIGNIEISGVCSCVWGMHMYGVYRCQCAIALNY